VPQQHKEGHSAITIRVSLDRQWTPLPFAGPGLCIGQQHPASRGRQAGLTTPVGEEGLCLHVLATQLGRVSDWRGVREEM